MTVVGTSGLAFPSDSMRPRPRTRFLGALAASVALHLLVLLWSERWTAVAIPQVDTKLPPPIEAVIVAAAEDAPSRVPGRAPRTGAGVRKVPQPAPETMAAVESPALASAIEPDPEAYRVAEPEAQPQRAEPEPIAQEADEPSPPPAQAMPRRAEVRYALVTGEEGVRVGTVYGAWTLEGDRYVARVMAEAEGLMSLFFTGQLIAESRGRLSAEGLRPDFFLLQRGWRGKTDVVQFDWEAMTATMTSASGRRLEALNGASQDGLSFVFQFPFTRPADHGYLFHVLNGRKVEWYAYTVIGEEQLPTALGPFKTLHVDRQRAPGERRVDAWLAMDFYHLPVRLRFTDKSGQVAELLLTALSIDP